MGKRSLRQVNVEIEREAFDALDSLASAEGVARSDLIRRALNQLFEERGVAARCVPTAVAYEQPGARPHGAQHRRFKA